VLNILAQICLITYVEKFKLTIFGVLSQYLTTQIILVKTIWTICPLW